MTVVDRLGSLQFDPLEVAGRNHDLVLLARIAGYRRDWTDALLYEERALFETYNKGLSLAADDRAAVLPRDLGPAPDRARAAAFRRARGRSSTSCSSGSGRAGRCRRRDVEPRAAIDWYWRPTNQVRAILEALAEAGVLGLARRDGNRRVYDLVERLFPAELLAERSRRPREQFRHKLLSRYRGPRAARARPGRPRSGSGRSRSRGAEDACRSGAAGADGAPRGARRPTGCIVPVAVEGVRGDRVRRRRRAAACSTQAEREVAAGRAARRRAARRRVPRPARPARLGPRVPADAASASTTSGRSTSRRRSGAGATTSCRSCSATGSSGGSSRGSIARPDTLRILGAWWEDGFDPLAERGVRRRASPRRSRPTGRSAASRESRWPRTARLRALGAAVKRRLASSAWRRAADAGARQRPVPTRRRQRSVDRRRRPGAPVAGLVAGRDPELVRVVRRRGRASSTSRVVLDQTIVQAPPSTRRWTWKEWRPDVRTWSVTSAPVQVTVTRFASAVAPAAIVGVVRASPWRRSGPGPSCRRRSRCFLPFDASIARPTPT